MKSFLIFSLIFIMICNALPAQDTIKVQRGDRYDRNCFLVICVDDKYFTDSIPRTLFSEKNNIELRINRDCTANKKFDIFVSSFEISVQNNEESQQPRAQSSFFTDRQKKLIQKIKPKNELLLKNIIVHAPDGFKKMDDLKIIIN